MYTNGTPDYFIFSCYKPLLIIQIIIIPLWIIMDTINIKNLNINTFELFVLNTEFNHHNLHKNFMRYYSSHITDEELEAESGIIFFKAKRQSLQIAELEFKPTVFCP